MTSASPFEVGSQLIALWKAGKAAEAITTLYSPDVISVEAVSRPGGERETRGIEACLAKGKQFRERCEVHGASAEGPLPHGDRVAALLRYDVTERATGERRTMQEIAVYTIQGGKVVREEFFYAL